jgi:uncharacterized membrane protein (GlpM family)
MKQRIKEEIKIAFWSLIALILIVGAMYFFSGHNDIISKNAHAVANMLRGGVQ